MVLCFYDGNYQTSDNHHYGMFLFLYDHLCYISLNVCLMPLQFEMTHNILEMDDNYVFMIFLIRILHLYIVNNDYSSIRYYILWIIMID